MAPMINYRGNSSDLFALERGSKGDIKYILLKSSLLTLAKIKICSRFQNK